MADWMKRLTNDTYFENSSGFLKTDVTHPKIIKTYKTILPLKLLPKLEASIRGPIKPHVWKFNESSS